jgi:nucleotide-binding universal stress UspA family protein
MSEIVVGYDGSDCSKAALDKACELAQKLGDKVAIVFGYAPGSYGGGKVPTHREAVEEIAEKVTAVAEGLCLRLHSAQAAASFWTACIGRAGERVALPFGGRLQRRKQARGV